jgi:exonuclease SbcC
MILRGLKLENIRSYLSEEVSFPEGSVLLSGDIGSGKSTVLLAVDFALFGIQKDLSGASLLRHGKESGSVELVFEVGGKEYTIKRTLKRKGGAVRQDTGYIISEGLRKDLTASEAKYFIINLLGYPEQALTKDSALVYKYTVYTPQEQMRQIMEGGEERLDIMRRIFDIDKYKRISENAQTVAREMRGNIREMKGSIQDLEEKKKQRGQLSEEKKKHEKSMKGLETRIEAENKRIDAARKELERLQKMIESVQKKRQEYAALKSEFSSLKERIGEIKSGLEDYEPKLKEIDEKLVVLKKLKKPEFTLQEIKKKIEALEAEDKGNIEKSVALRTEIESMKEILDRGVCGTCKQKVHDPASFKKDITDLVARLKELEKKGRHTSGGIESMRKMKDEIQRYGLVKNEMESLEKRRGDLVDSKTRLERELGSNSRRIREAMEKANSIARELKDDTLSQELKGKQEQLDELRASKEEIVKEKSNLDGVVNTLKDRIDSLEKEIKAKEGQKKKIESYQKYENWLSGFFVNLMATIERHVMVNIQHEFNSLFQKWFSMLVMDEALDARIDEKFSPTIEQNGFETDYAYLSGGERTAIALAYRLALNKVINDRIEKIRTKDLIILDEPTDGFSSEQMNSVRDVLNELNNRQTIIVSHESKIENFVDTTVRFVKENGVSKVDF